MTLPEQTIVGRVTTCQHKKGHFNAKSLLKEHHIAFDLA
jgi:hypothetical protein